MTYSTFHNLFLNAMQFAILISMEALFLLLGFVFWTTKVVNSSGIVSYICMLP